MASITKPKPLNIWISLTLFACFLPFIALGNVNLYLAEVIIYLSLPFLLTCKFKIHIDLFLSFTILTLIGFLHAIGNQDVMDVIIPSRSFALFYISYILIQLPSQRQIIEIFGKCLFIICFVYTLYISQTMYLIISGKISILSFLYDYDLGRIKAFYENGTTSVVIGSLLSILFTLALCSKNLKFRKSFMVTLFILGLLTASRSNTLSNIIALIIYYCMTKSQFTLSSGIRTLTLLLIILFSLYAIMLKIILANVNIDGSALTRLKFYVIAFESAQSISDLFLGHGYTEKALYNKFGISFFESYFVNSYMQAGLVGLLSSTFIIFRVVLIYNLPKRTAFTILGSILVANLIGGANLFSIFVLPFLLLGLRATENEQAASCKRNM